MDYIEFKRKRGRDKKKRKKKSSTDKKFPAKTLSATGIAGLGVVALARSKNYNPGALIQKGSKFVTKNAAKGAATGATEGAIEGAVLGVKNSANKTVEAVKNYYNLPKKIKQAQNNFRKELTSKNKPSGKAAKIGKNAAKILKKFKPQTKN